MNLNKSLEFFDPDKVDAPCHIIGCGSIGSNVAELLVRYGVRNITLYDFDLVESHNLANQLYTEKHIGRKKNECLKEMLCDINPELEKTISIEDRYVDQVLEGYVFMCVDSVEVRNQIVDNIFYSPVVKAVFDFRTTLLEGQCYYANWNEYKDKNSLKTSLDFTHEEAMENTPVSACGFELSVAPVVRMTAQMGIVNFTNLINNEPVKRLILVRPYSYYLEAI